MAGDDDGGGYLTFAVATRSGGEKTVDRREQGSEDEVSAWVSGLLAEHGETPGLDRCRVRRWAKGGRPVGGIVLRPAAEPATPVKSIAPQPADTPERDEADRLARRLARAQRDREDLAAEVRRLRVRVAAAKDEHTRLRRLEAEVATLRADRDVLRAEVARRDVLEERAARMITDLRRQNDA